MFQSILGDEVMILDQDTLKSFIFIAGDICILRDEIAELKKEIEQLKHHHHSGGHGCTTGLIILGSRWENNCQG